MIPLTQTLFSDPENHLRGNCLQTCIASILELPLEKVPHFVSFGDEWFTKLWEWFQEYGMMPIFVTPKDQHKAVGFTVGTGPGPRGFRHAVVCYDREIVHDPHPSRAGLTSIDEWLTFVLIDPAKLRKLA